jgi:hypothetical protein
VAIFRRRKMASTSVKILRVNSKTKVKRTMKAVIMKTRVRMMMRTSKWATLALRRRPWTKR